MNDTNTTRYHILKVISFVTFCCIICTSIAQSPSIRWKKTFGGSESEEALSVKSTADGGSIIAGFTSSKNGNVTTQKGEGDFWVVKLDSLGTLQWQKTIGGGSPDLAYAINVTNDGGYIVAGTSVSGNCFTCNGDVQGYVQGYHSSTFNFWVVKLSSTGTIEWSKILGGVVEKAYSIQQTKDNGYIVAGSCGGDKGDVSGNHSGSLNSPVDDAWIVKLNSTGNIEWQKSLGGSNRDVAYCVKQTTDEGYIVSGEAYSNDGDVSGNHSLSNDAWVVKLTNTGAIEWQKCLGGTGSEISHEIHQTTDGGYVLSGLSSSNDGDLTSNKGSSDIWLVKLSSTGSIEWQKSLGGSGFDRAYSIQQTKDGGYIVGAITNSDDGDVIGWHYGTTTGIVRNTYDMWVVKFNSQGSLVWQKCLGGSKDEYAYSISQTVDMGYIVVGYAQSTNGDVLGFRGGFNDWWVVKIAPDSIATSVNESREHEHLSVYPNPATNSLKIDFKVEDDLDFFVYGMDGVKVEGVQLENYNIDISNLPNGLYCLEFRNKQTVKRIKFFKR